MREKERDRVGSNFSRCMHGVGLLDYAESLWVRFQTKLEKEQSEVRLPSRHAA